MHLSKHSLVLLLGKFGKKILYKIWLQTRFPGWHKFLFCYAKIEINSIVFTQIKKFQVLTTKNWNQLSSVNQSNTQNQTVLWPSICSLLCLWQTQTTRNNQLIWPSKMTLFPQKKIWKYMGVLKQTSVLQVRNLFIRI